MPTCKWFCEKDVPGRRKGAVKHCFLIDKLIFQAKTRFQKVLIFQNSLYGRVFCLDNIVQFSEKDEFIYHETMAHTALFSHPKPENILIIGGGDAGVAREVLKHPVQKIDLVEIDKEIISISKKYLKVVCENAFSDKRLRIYNAPGQDFVKQRKGVYDIVFVDSTNFGKKQANPLYTNKFYKDVFSALKRDGIMIALGASFLDFEGLVKPHLIELKKVFSFVFAIRFCMPSYHCGEYYFLLGSKKIDLEKADFKKIEKRFKELLKKHSFRYYSPKTHQLNMLLANQTIEIKPSRTVLDG